jgi:hypothetical protein
VAGYLIFDMDCLKKYKWLVLFCVVLIDCVLIYFQNFHHFASTNLDFINRGIEGNFKLITNGYLGVFFYIKYFGLFSWLILPIGIYYARKNKFNLLLFALFVIIALIIGFLGYINFRYAYTIALPIQLTIILFLFSNNFFDDKIFTVSFVLLNICHFLFFISIDMVPKYYKRINLSSNTLKKEKSIFEFIEEDTKKDATFLVNNIPQFYYYTKRYGYFYWCKEDELFLKDKKIKLFNDTNLSIVHKNLQDLQVEYIFSDTLFNKYSKIFNSYLNHYTQPVFRQEKWVVYQIK